MTQKQKESITLVAVGDVSPNRDDPPSIFRHCGDVFRKADIVFGQLESPLSDRGTGVFIYHAPCRLGAKNISALTKEGADFDVMSFAGNHSMDYGWEAFYDTLDALKKNNIAVVGAGRNIQEARKPAILERKGTKIGFLSYLTIVVPGLTATDKVPGCAPLQATTAYQPIDPRPGAPPVVITQLFPEDREAMEADIRKLRPQVDVLVVCHHTGVTHVPVVIATCQKEGAYAAIDAGADLVIQHHAHILKGIEVYKGKAIFYGTNHFCIEHGLASAPTYRAGRMEAWDPGYVKASAQIYARYRRRGYHFRTMVVKAVIQDKKIQKVSFIPAYINSNREPEVLTRQDPRAQEVFDYVKEISEDEDLKVKLSWDGDEVVIGT